MVRYLVDRYADGEREALRGRGQAGAPSSIPDVGSITRYAQAGQFETSRICRAASARTNGTVGC
jgi:hypothetical protein